MTLTGTPLMSRPGAWKFSAHATVSTSRVIPIVGAEAGRPNQLSAAGSESDSLGHSANSAR